MAQITVSRRERGAFAIDRDDLFAIEAVLRRFSPDEEVACRVAFSGGREATYPSVAQLLGDSFLQSHSISEISLSVGRGPEWVRLEFGKHWTSPVGVFISADRQAALSLEVEFDNLLVRPRRWFYRLRRILSASTPDLTVALALAAIPVVVFAAVSIHFKLDFATWTAIWMGLTFISAVSAFIPSMVFKIGRSGRRLQLSHAIIGFLFLVLLVPALINWFTDWTGPTNWFGQR